MGGNLDDALKGMSVPQGEIIRTADHPLEKNGCYAILKGNLAPKGAVVKKTQQTSRPGRLNIIDKRIKR